MAMIVGKLEEEGGQKALEEVLGFGFELDLLYRMKDMQHQTMSARKKKLVMQFEIKTDTFCN